MKPNKDTMICDRCKKIVATHKCLGCEEDICDNCYSIFTIEMKTSNRKYNTKSPSNFYSSGQYASANKILNSGYIICKKCKKALDNKQAAEVIKESEEMKKLIEKIKKTVLSSRMLNGLEESEVKDDDNYNPSWGVDSRLYRQISSAG
jgi:hypothetical protein